MQKVEQKPIHATLLDRLNESIEGGKFPHAMMFLGPEGGGAFQVGLEVAKSILRKGKEQSESLEKMLADQAHPDWHFVFPYVKTSSGSPRDETPDNMENWRAQIQESPFFSLTQWLERTSGDVNKQAIIPVVTSAEVIRKLNMRSHSGGYKVLFMWLPEKLHVSAANKLLKIIEEPPEKTVFVIVSENQEEVLSTIVSRTQVYRVPLPDDREVAEYLIDHEAADPAKAENIAAVVEGNIARARDLIRDDVEEGDHHKIFVEWMRVCYKKDVISMIEMAETLAGYKRVRVMSMLEYALHIFRQCLISNYAGSDLARLTSNQEKFAQNFSPFVNGRNVELLLEDFDKAHYHVSRNGNPKIILLDLSFRVMRHLRR